MKRKLQRLFSDDLLRQLAGKSIFAFLVKVGGAGFSFLMFVALARAMSIEEYGFFAFGFSLATFAALITIMGQRTLVLRFTPIYHGGESRDPAALRGLFLFSYGIVFGVSLITALAVILLAPVLGWDGRPYLLFAAALILPMALSDLQSGIYRGLGMVLPALMPRDIFWRIGTILFCLPAIFSWSRLPFSQGLTGRQALALTGAVLTCLVFYQLATRRVVPRIMLTGPGAVYKIQEWKHASLGLWVLGIIQTGAPNLAVILIGLVMSPETTAGLFAAIKAANLLNFFLLAANIVVAPQISRLWHNNQTRQVERISAMVTIGATIPTLLLFLIYVFFGHWLLNLFGEGFEKSYPSLLILSFGQLLSTLCGQTGILMTMTGNERKLMLFVLISNLIPLALLPFGAMIFGEVFGAIAVAAGMAAWNILAVFWSRRSLGIDTSIVGALTLILRKDRSNG